jgi:hypothetical protein
MPTETAEKELVRLDDPCIVTGAQGIASIDRNTFKNMMTGAPWSIAD